jgi:hypothetical protein
MHISYVYQYIFLRPVPGHVMCIDANLKMQLTGVGAGGGTSVCRIFKFGSGVWGNDSNGLARLRLGLQHLQ